MEIAFSEMSVDTTLAQEYLKKNEALLELYNDYDEIIKKFSPYVYDGKVFDKQSSTYVFDGKKYDKILNKESVPQCPTPHEDALKILQNLASGLKQNASLISQLEYHFRNIPIEDTDAQLSLLIQNLRCQSPAAGLCKDYRSHMQFSPNDPLLAFGNVVNMIWYSIYSNALVSESKATAPICHLFITLCHEAGIKDIILVFQHDLFDKEPQNLLRKPVKGLDSGTVAVVSEDADVDSAIDKFLSASKQAPWRLRRILVQENVYQQFKDALRWKCNLNKSEIKPLASPVLCSETLTYKDRTFLIDPVECSEQQPSVVTVEAYRTTKEMISLVQKDETRYLSLWTNGIAAINEITHSTKAPVVWVNNLADFRGPPQVSEAVYSYVFDNDVSIKKCKNVVKLCELVQSWQKLNIESRRDILYGVLDKCTLSNPLNKVYTDIKTSLSDCTMKSFVDVGKDYVCMGISKPIGIMTIEYKTNFFTVKNFKSVLQGNAFILYTVGPPSVQSELGLLEQVGVPVICVGDFVEGDFKVVSWHSDTRTRVIWTNSGTIFAN